jgi:hypothetical protein
MIDITQDVRSAISQDVLWAVEMFFIIKEQLKNNGYEILFWENEENWATIDIEDRSIGFIWKRYPLIFIIDEDAKPIENLLKDYDFMTFIEVADFKAEILKINYQEFKDRIEFGLNQDQFSVYDFWSATNSI